MNPIKISRKYGCGIADAMKRLYAAKEANVSMDRVLENDLFCMEAGELRRYLANKSLQMYSQLVAEHEKTTEYEACRQIRRAQKEFGVPYSIFNRENLFNADDDRLKAVKARITRKNNNAIKKIARAANLSFDEAKSLVMDLKTRYKVTADFCYTHKLYNKTDDEIKEIAGSAKERIKAKKDAVLQEMGWTADQLKEHIAKCSHQYRIGSDYYYSLKCYRLTDEQLSGVLAHSDIHRLSAMFNKDPKRVDDKDQFLVHFKEYLGRKAWANSDTDFEEFQKFVDGLDEIFVKPVDGMHGTGAKKISLTETGLRDVYDGLMSEKPLVAEEVIAQHPKMAAFNPSSINTVRIYTIQDGDEVDIVNAYARFGNGGIVDNYSSGGFECGVDMETGVINTPAVCKNGEVFDEHPLTHLVFEGFQIPLWEEAIERVSAAVRSIDGINLVGWDVAIGPDGVILVEGNTDPGPGAFQRFLLERGESMRDRFSEYLERLQ